MAGPRLIPVLLAPLLLVSACVTERVAPRGTPVRASRSATSAPSSSKAGPNATLPDGPVATPAAGITTTSRVQVEIVPLGRVAYDGQALPLPSPDGRFIAAQQGEAPTWETILAEPAAELPLGTSIAVYDAANLPLTRVPHAQPLPGGLLLGRACDDRGFLVESPRPDGSRWIGRVAWATGSLEWLVQGEEVNAHAVFTPTGDLLFTRRSLSVSVASLVLRTPSGVDAVRTPTDGSYIYPIACASPDIVYTLCLTAAGTFLETLRCESTDGRPKLGAILARRLMTPGATTLLAHQMAAHLQQPFPRDTAAENASARLAIFHPMLQRMIEFNPDNSGITLLAPASVAAAPAARASRPGYFCTTPDGLVFCPTDAKNPEQQPPARVIAGPYVPRLVNSDVPTMLLFGPVTGRPDLMEVVRLYLTAPAPPKS